MYQDYLDDIISFYRTAATQARIPQRLIRPTPANIKEECLFVYKTRFRKTDLEMLVTFFGAEADQEAMLRQIQRCDRDKFKPLANFLKGATGSTEDRNIELLAWLVNFPDRPYKSEHYANESLRKPYKTWNNNVAEGEEIVPKVGETRTVDNEDPSVDKTSGMRLATEIPKVGGGIAANRFAVPVLRKKGLISIITVMLLLILVGVYFVREKETAFGVVNYGPQKCMMWVGDHYVPTSCEPKREDTLVVAFDVQRINNFKRITRPDTITILSIGRIWYIKRNGEIEYYTAGGRHPVEPDRMLKPITKYIILKYSPPRR